MRNFGSSSSKIYYEGDLLSYASQNFAIHYARLRIIKATGVLKQTSNLVLTISWSSKWIICKLPLTVEVSLEMFEINSTNHTSQKSTTKVSSPLSNQIPDAHSGKTHSWHPPLKLNCSSFSPPSSIILFLLSFHLGYVLQPIFFK